MVENNTESRRHKALYKTCSTREILVKVTLCLHVHNEGRVVTHR